MPQNAGMAANTTSLPTTPEDGGHQSQTIRAVLGLRGLIIEGALQPGARVLEQMLVDRLGVSRTPARVAMLRVCEEGLLEELPTGGYAVARFSEEDVFDAIAIRGTLEGMAARLAAERGVSPILLSKMRRCVDDLDDVIERLNTSPDLTDYVRLNDRFHDLMYEAAQSPMLKRSLERLVVLPFAAPNAFVSVTQSDTAAVRAVWAAAGFTDTLLRWKMKPEVVHGEKKDIQPRVQTRGSQVGHRAWGGSGPGGQGPGRSRERAAQVGA